MSDEGLNRLLPVRSAKTLGELLTLNIEAREAQAAEALAYCGPARHMVEYCRAQSDTLRDLRDLLGPTAALSLSLPTRAA
jgi:hypothetical protein